MPKSVTPCPDLDLLSAVTGGDDGTSPQSCVRISARVFTQFSTFALSPPEEARNLVKELQDTCLRFGLVSAEDPIGTGKLGELEKSLVDERSARRRAEAELAELQHQHKELASLPYEETARANHSDDLQDDKKSDDLLTEQQAVVAHLVKPTAIPAPAGDQPASTDAPPLTVTTAPRQDTAAPSHALKAHLHKIVDSDPFYGSRADLRRFKT